MNYLSDFDNQHAGRFHQVTFVTLRDALRVHLRIGRQSADNVMYGMSVVEQVVGKSNKQVAKGLTETNHV